MRREHRRDADLLQQRQRNLAREPRIPQPPQRASQTSALRLSRSLQQRRPPSPLAVVCFRQINQLKIKRKRPRQKKRRPRVRRHLVRQRLRLLQMPLRRLCILFRIRLAPRNRRAPQTLHRAKQRVARLLPQHLPQQRTQRPHIAAQRRILRRAVACFKFRKSIRPTGRRPKRRHR